MTWATSANFSLPRPLCSPVRPDVRDTDRQMSDRRQTDVRQTDRRQTKASLTMPPLWGGEGHNSTVSKLGRPNVLVTPS